MRDYIPLFYFDVITYPSLILVLIYLTLFAKQTPGLIKLGVKLVLFNYLIGGLHATDPGANYTKRVYFDDYAN